MNAAAGLADTREIIRACAGQWLSRWLFHSSPFLSIAALFTRIGFFPNSAALDFPPGLLSFSAVRYFLVKIFHFFILSMGNVVFTCIILEFKILTLPWWLNGCWRSPMTYLIMGAQLNPVFHSTLWFTYSTVCFSARKHGFIKAFLRALCIDRTRQENLAVSLLWLSSCDKGLKLKRGKIKRNMRARVYRARETLASSVSAELCRLFRPRRKQVPRLEHKQKASV